MAPKTAPKTFADIVAEADLKAIEKARKARADLEKLKERIGEYAELHNEAAARVNWLRSQFQRGNADAATAEEFALALATEERAKYLAHAHTENEDKRVKNAERALPPAEKKLARAVAAALEGFIPGIKVLSTFGKVEEIPSEGDLPVLLVSQEKPSGDTFRDSRERGWAALSGTSAVNLSGDVVLTLYRKPLHRELYAPKLGKHLTENGVHLLDQSNLQHAQTMTDSRDGMEIDTLRVSIRSIANPDTKPEDVKQVGKPLTVDPELNMSATEAWMKATARRHDPSEYKSSDHPGAITAGTIR
ncbi:hypothetical protein SUDANB15_02613 [Streptomyces sp. enrichment culture]|uniref:hypothetical protein n=1 Tax=Streptomyces sp. enrichment culture TaxID=1795815 RepID=UPI003F55041D